MKFTSKTLQTEHDSLHDLIGVLTGAYQLLADSQERAYIQAWKRYREDLADGVYSPDEAKRRLNDARKSANADFDAKRAEINGDLVNAVKRLYSHVVDTVAPKRAADHATRVSVALQLLSLEGKDLTDKVAADILKEFIAGRDFDAMETFYRVIDKQVGPSKNALVPETAGGTILTKPNGAPAWPETFGDLFIYRRLMSGLDDLLSLTGNMYVHPRKEGFDNILAGERDIVPLDGYNESFAEATAPEMAADLEKEISYFLDDN